MILYNFNALNKLHKKEISPYSYRSYSYLLGSECHGLFIKEIGHANLIRPCSKSCITRASIKHG